MLAVAHRLSTIARMDRIIVMDEGKIVEDGDKDKVLNDDNLTNLFDWPIKVIKENGYYQVIPG